MQVRTTPEVNNLIDSAVSVSVQRGKYFVGVEHLFEAIVQHAHELPGAFEKKHLALLEQTRNLLGKYVWQGTPPTAGGEIFYTPRCAATLTEASRLSDRLRSGSAATGHVLMALLMDTHSVVCRTMESEGIDRKLLFEDLRQTLATLAPANPATTATRETQPSTSPAVTIRDPLLQETSDPAVQPAATLDSFTRDLTADARAHTIEGALGRDQEIIEVLQILARQGKNNVILVGEAGTGKTKIAEGIAVAAASGQLGEALDFERVLELNISGLMAGTQYRGALEEKVIALLDELEGQRDTVLFIDEIHLIMGAGATEGDSIDFANLLKPALGRGKLRCIGATTVQEYRKFIEKDPALERRFQMVRVDELGTEATMHILQHMKPALEKHHQVHIHPQTLKTTISMTARYLPNRNQPDKSIDILDQACARARINTLLKRNGRKKGNQAQSITVDSHDIRKVVSQLSGVPLEEITAEERNRLTDLERTIGQRIIGQDDAVAKVVSAVKKARAGLADPHRPDSVMLFLGPTGVGKTQLAKELARTVFGSTEHLATFDMSEYVEPHSVSRLLGAPPGYQGSDREGLLTSAVKNDPYSVLLFDEIEKAHPQIFDILLPILDEGRIKDSEGRMVSFRNCIILFTSNIGAERLGNSPVAEQARDMLGDLREHFRPEFINRIDEIVPFYPLLREDVREVLKIMIDAVRARLSDRGMGIRMYQRAYEFLAQEGYSPEFGARELKRCVERHIATPISEAILEGTFSDGDMIDVLMEEGVLRYRKGAPRRRNREQAEVAS